MAKPQSRSANAHSEPSPSMNAPPSILQGENEGQQSASSKSNYNDPALDTTFMTAKSNLMDVSGYKVSPNVGKKFSGSSEPVILDPVFGKKFSGSSEPVILDPVSATAAREKETPYRPEYAKMQTDSKNKIEEQHQKQPKPEARKTQKQEQPQKKNRPKPAPATAPAVMAGKEKRLEKAKPTTPAPASSGKPKKAPGSGAFGGVKSWLIKKLNPDAKECYLPETEEQPYYDEKAKRWIFPGDDPAEVCKPLAPPPTIPTTEQDDASKPKEDTKPKDALSSMMAPPKSRIPGKKRAIGGPPGGLGSPMMMGGMMSPPGGFPQGMMSPPGLVGTTTPKFATFTPPAAVFTPKPATKIPEEEEEEPSNNAAGEE